MKIGFNVCMWWFFAILLTAAIKLGLDQWWGITSSNLWGSICTSIIAFTFGFGIVGFFRKRVMKSVIVGGAQK